MVAMSVSEGSESESERSVTRGLAIFTGFCWCVKRKRERWGGKMDSNIDLICADRLGHMGWAYSGGLGYAHYPEVHESDNCENAMRSSRCTCYPGAESVLQATLKCALPGTVHYFVPPSTNSVRSLRVHLY